MSGSGKLTGPEGTYEGDFVQGRRHGVGLQLYRSGDEYYGSWRFGKFDGKGKYFDSKSGVTRDGVWKSGNFMSSNIKVTNPTTASTFNAGF
jgi:hypothetical protein